MPVVNFTAPVRNGKRRKRRRRRFNFYPTLPIEASNLDLELHVGAGDAQLCIEVSEFLI